MVLLTLGPHLQLAAAARTQHSLALWLPAVIVSSLAPRHRRFSFGTTRRRGARCTAAHSTADCVCCWQRRRQWTTVGDASRCYRCCCTVVATTSAAAEPTTS